MIDQRLIRSDPDGVREALARRGAADGVDQFLALDTQRRELLGRVEATRAERNAAAKAIAEARQRGEDAAAEIAAQSELKAAQAAGEAELAELERQVGELMLTIPNIPHPFAPLGDTDEDAEVLRVVGSPPEFGFPARDHLDIAGPDGLGLIDQEAAARVSGSRFHYLIGDLVRLDLSLVQYGMQKLSALGFTPVVPPVLVKEEAMVGTGFFPEARTQVYGLETDPLFLVGTAEVPLASLIGDTILDASSCRCTTWATRAASGARPAPPARTRVGSSGCTSSTSSSCSAIACPKPRGTSRR